MGQYRNKHKFELEAIDAGFVHIGYGKTTTYHRYKCVKCGDILEREHKTVKSKTVLCYRCALIKRAIEANNVGLILLPFGINDKEGYRYYKCIKSGHKLHLHVGTVRQGSKNYCRECREDKRDIEAAMEGLVINKEYSHPDKSYRKYRHICGTEFLATTSSVRRGEVRCPSCGGGKWDKPGFLYTLKIIKDSVIYYKVGISTNTGNRLTTLKPAHGVDVQIIKSIRLSTLRQAFKLEKIILELIQDSGGRLPAEEGKMLVSSGYTEITTSYTPIQKCLAILTDIVIFHKETSTML